MCFARFAGAGSLRSRALALCFPLARTCRARACRSRHEKRNPLSNTRQTASKDAGASSDRVGQRMMQQVRPGLGQCVNGTPSHLCDLATVRYAGCSGHDRTAEEMCNQRAVGERVRAHKRFNADLDPGLLPHLSQNRLFRCLAELQCAAGKTPPPAVVVLLDQEHRSTVVSEHSSPSCFHQIRGYLVTCEFGRNMRAFARRSLCSVGSRL